MKKLFSRISILVTGLALSLGMGIAAMHGINSGFKSAKAASTIATSIAAGDQVIITNKDDNRYLSGISGNLGTATTYSSTTPPETFVLTVETGNKTGSFSFKNGDDYLSWASGNNLTTSTEKNDASSWTVSFEGNSATVLNVGTPARKLQYNSGSPRFACYTSAQQLIHFYIVSGSGPYSVTYDANGATSGTAPTDANSPYESETQVTVLGNTGNLEKTGYTWNGWNTKADGSGTTYTAGNQFTITTSTTLYAKWEEVVVPLPSAGTLSITDDDFTGSYEGGALQSKTTTITGGAKVNWKYQHIMKNTGIQFRKYADGPAVLYNTTDLGNILSVEITGTTSLTVTYGTSENDGCTSSAPGTGNGFFKIINNTSGAVKPSAITITWGAPVTLNGITAVQSSTSQAKTYYVGDFVTGADFEVTTNYSDSSLNSTITDGTGVYFDSEFTQTQYELSLGNSNAVTVYYKDAGLRTAHTAAAVTISNEVIEKTDLPVGTYSVTLSISGSGVSIPASTLHELKAQEGNVKYKDLRLNYTNVTNNYANEYTLASSTGVISTTNNSNAVITTVEIDYYKYENASVYVGTEKITGTDGAASGKTDSLMKIFEINNSNFELRNEDTSHAQSLYSIKINLEVTNENVEFHSLVVSKSVSWNKTDYKDGQAPSNEGLVVTANYTDDSGASICSSQDVTNQVSNWAYTPATLTTGDTSFSVVATWNDHESAPFVVDGINVTEVTGPLTNGQYYILNHDKTIGMSAVAATSASPTGVEITDEDYSGLVPFDLTLVDDNEYEISTTIETTKYYLACTTTAASGSNTSIRVTTAENDTWHLDNTDVETQGAYHVYTVVTSEISRYLAQAEGQSGPDWRGYVNTNNGDPEIQFVPYQEPAPTVTGISVKTAPTTTSYKEGAHFDPTGLVITVTYSDTSVTDVEYAGHESDFTFSPALTADLTLSDASVTVTYGGQTAEIAINVTAKTIVSVDSVADAPSAIAVGQGILGEEVTLNVTYDDSTQGTVHAHHVTVDDSQPADNVVATAYLDQDETPALSIQFTVNVIIPGESVYTFAKAFLKKTNLACSAAEADRVQALQNAWTELEALFNPLDADDKSIIRFAEADYEHDFSTYSDAEIDAVTDAETLGYLAGAACARYDWLCKKYGTQLGSNYNFLSRTSANASNFYMFNRNGINSNVLLITLISSLTVIAAFGACMMLLKKKRKHN